MQQSSQPKLLFKEACIRHGGQLPSCFPNIWYHQNTRGRWGGGGWGVQASIQSSSPCGGRTVLDLGSFCILMCVTHAIPPGGQRLPGRDTGLAETMKGSSTAFATEKSQLSSEQSWQLLQYPHHARLRWASWRREWGLSNSKHSSNHIFSGTLGFSTANT